MIVGEKSDEFWHHGTRALAEGLPTGLHRTLAGQSHEVAPDALAPLMDEFFAD